jgi:hypothetical protein
MRITTNIVYPIDLMIDPSDHLNKQRLFDKW